MKIVNLMPHPATLRCECGDVTIAPEPVAARVTATNRKVGSIEIPGYMQAEGFPLYALEFGAITGLPEPATDTVYLVSMLVAQAAKRADVFSPDSGPTAIRENGQIVAVLGLISWV